MSGIGVSVVMSAARAGRGCRHGMAEQNVGGDLQPRRVVIAITVDHRRSRHRLHRQSQQQKGNNKTAYALGHEKKYSISTHTPLQLPKRSCDCRSKRSSAGLLAPVLRCIRLLR